MWVDRFTCQDASGTNKYTGNSNTQFTIQGGRDPMAQGCYESIKVSPSTYYIANSLSGSADDLSLHGV